MEGRYWDIEDFDLELDDPPEGHHKQGDDPPDLPDPT